MNIWIVKIGEPLESNMRNYLLGRELLQRGHQVTYFTSGFNHQQKKWVKRAEGPYHSKDGLLLEIVNGCGYRKNFSLRRYLDHKIIAWKFARRIREKKKPDLILASLPPHFLVSISAEYAKENDIPIVVDIRDPWPDVIVDKLPFFLKPLLAKDVQRTKEALKQATSLVGVSMDLLRWGLKKANREKTENDKVFYLGARKLQEVPLKTEMTEFLERESKIIGYVGSFGENADPSLVLEFVKNNPGYSLILMGDGWLRKRLEREYGCLENVYFTGWLEPEMVFSILKKCTLGVCPTATDIPLLPNKIFTYLSVGLPILSAYKGEAKDLIEGGDFGLFYQKDSLEDFSQKIKRIIGKVPTQTFEDLFDSEKIYSEYANHLEQYGENN